MPASLPRPLHIRLDPQPTPRHTPAIDEVCTTLTDTDTTNPGTTNPGTTLAMRYRTKSHHRPHTNC
jgi:hypothetical protein